MPYEKTAERDLAADQALVMQDLLTGKALRHSIDPPVSDFTAAAGVPADEVLSILNNWHNQGLVFNKIANDDFEQDGVPTMWRLNYNGYHTVKDLATPPTLTAINPNTGAKNTTVTITATGTGFDDTCNISMPDANVLSNAYVSDTELTAEVELPLPPPGPINVTVVNRTWGTETDPLPFTVTPT